MWLELAKKSFENISKAFMAFKMFYQQRATLKELVKEKRSSA